ncbi:MAG: hypothetical protein U0821_00815 [Chloroflexota bacterium]
MAADHQVWRLAQARVALVTTLRSVLAGSALRAVGLEAAEAGSSGALSGRWEAGVVGSGGRTGELVDLGLELRDASGELDDECLKPGDGFALGEDDIDELFFGQREQCGTIIHAASVSKRVLERRTSVKFASSVASTRRG